MTQQRYFITCMICVFFAFVGCVSDTDITDFESRSAEELYNLGESSLESSNKPEKSVVFFQQVERLYPYSEWAKRATIMTAFAQHKARLYAESRATAERFIESYPTDDDTAYAAYLIALSYYDQIEDVGRDQGVTLEALQALRTVFETYPDSDYAVSAQLKFDLAFDHLAAKEVEVGRYYLKQRNYAAAVNRFRVVVEDYQTTTHTPEALHRLVEAYLGLGLRDEAQTAAAILGYNYQSSPFYEDSFVLLRNQGLEPKARPNDGWLGQAYRQMLRGEWL